MRSLAEPRAILKALRIEPGAQHTSQALANTQAQRWQRDTSLAQRRSWLALRRWAPRPGTTLVLRLARRRSALAPRLSLLALQSAGTSGQRLLERERTQLARRLQLEPSTL